MLLPDRRSNGAAKLAAFACGFHERERLRSAGDVAELVHEHAELVSREGRRWYGRRRIVEALLGDREAVCCSGEIERYELLDETTLLVAGRTRLSVENGSVGSTVFWVDAFRDGLLWRVSAFPSAAAACEAYDTG